MRLLARREMMMMMMMTLKYNNYDVLTGSQQEATWNQNLYNKIGLS